MSAWGVREPSTTVIVATYQQPQALELVLAALSVQTDRGFDVVVADDGSTPPADAVARRAAAAFGLEARSVWQPDAGFRKARAQNVAALRTDAELLVFLDGDCLPFRDMIAHYRRAARPDEFCVGAVLLLDAARTAALNAPAVREGAHERALTARERARLTRLHWGNRLDFGRRRSRPRIRGGNFAVASSLFAAVDGYDESFCGYGKEDSDLRNRMRNAGARGISLWNRAVAVHLARDVVRGGDRRERAPRALYEAGRGRVRARIGLSSHAVDAGSMDAAS